LRFFALSYTATLALGDSWTFDAVPTSTEVTASTRAIRTAELRL
jgi:hypothetical protein